MTVKQISRTPEEATIEIQIRMQQVLDIVEKIQETLDGTLRTRGLRDKMLLAEQDIAANKKAWSDLTTLIGTVKDDLLAKIDSVSKAEGETKTIIGKWQPYVNAFTWLVAGAASILLGMLLSGKLVFVLK